VPVFEFKITEILANMLKLPNYMNIKGTIIFHCSYFNSLPSKWEPVIEKWGADFELANGENPKTAFSLVTNQNFNTLNLNISEQMVPGGPFFLKNLLL